MVHQRVEKSKAPSLFGPREQISRLGPTLTVVGRVAPLHGLLPVLPRNRERNDLVAWQLQRPIHVLPEGILRSRCCGELRHDARWSGATVRLRSRGGRLGATSERNSQKRGCRQRGAGQNTAHGTSSARDIIHAIQSTEYI